MTCKTDPAIARTIGIDTGKNTLHIIGLDENGAIVLREKVSRSRIGARLANIPRCLIGIEAGMATHYVARDLIALGHDVKASAASLFQAVPSRSQERLPRCLCSR
jgi:transposase